MLEQTLTITEIYKSIQGESSFAGRPCTFIRLSGCPLRCRWCDTAYSFKGGKVQNFNEIIGEVKDLGAPLVELTGGEPLAQSGVEDLCRVLLDLGYQVLIETSGSEDIGRLPAETHVIMDIKCPGSGMQDRNDWENIAKLKLTDEIKFVIASREDFAWALQIVNKYHLQLVAQILFSPAFALVQPKDLVEWILESGINARLNMQLHKYIWHPRTKGV